MSRLDDVAKSLELATAIANALGSIRLAVDDVELSEQFPQTVLACLKTLSTTLAESGKIDAVCEWYPPRVVRTCELTLEPSMHAAMVKLAYIALSAIQLAEQEARESSTCLGWQELREYLRYFTRFDSTEAEVELRVEYRQAVAAIEKANGERDRFTQPRDGAPDPFVEAGKLWPKFAFANYTEFKAFLEEYGVANEPKGQRRMVHAADCLRAIAERDRKAEAAMDIAGDVVQGVKEQVEKVRAESLRRKRTGK